MSGPPGKNFEKSTSSSKTTDLERLAHGFAEEVADTLENVLPEAPLTEAVGRGGRFVIRPGKDEGEGPGAVPLLIDGEGVASLEFSILCRLDSARRYLAVGKSSYRVLANVDRSPILRFEYEREMDKAPHAHIHVHAHRGALSHLLSKAGHATPHDMSSLHIPVGGSRLRPCLEDLLEFLIVECGFDYVDGWREHVEAGRERWRRKQVAAIVRDVHTDAADTLRNLGYTVTPPVPLPDESAKALRKW